MSGSSTMHSMVMAAEGLFTYCPIHILAHLCSLAIPSLVGHPWLHSVSIFQLDTFLPGTYSCTVLAEKY